LLRKVLGLLSSLTLGGALLCAQTSGVARVSTSFAAASDTLDNLLRSATDVEIKRAAVEAIGSARSSTPQLMSRLGQLLSDEDERTVELTLRTIGNLGPVAIKSLSPEMANLLRSTKNPAIASRTRELLGIQ
jgi:hypothetical protein